MLGKDYIKVLRIDLDRKKITIDRRKDLVEYLGGTGVAAKLLDEYVDAGADPLDPQQPVVFAIGPMTTAFPICTKAVAVFRSPLTGDYGESHSGGRFAMAMRFAGYDAIVISGKSEKPVYLSISNNNVNFEDAGYLWGLSIEKTGAILRERESKIGSGKRSILRIGQAGENLVRFAALNVDTYRHFGRLGLGAVFGSKNLKALVIGGNRSYTLPDMPAYGKLYQEIYRTITDSPAMKKYHELGTAQNIMPLNIASGLPTRNLTSTSFEDAEKISGEAFAEELLLRKITCSGCPVGCIHIGLLREEFAEGYEYKYTGVGYDYELIYSLGSMLGVGDKKNILQLIERVEGYGLDAMSAGVALAWLTEAISTGLVEEGPELRFGDAVGYLQALDFLAQGEKCEFAVYRELSKGVDQAVKTFGGGDFACTLGKNEMAGYHTGYGSILGQAFGSRHSHLDNGGYSFDQQKGFDLDNLVDELIKEEAERDMLTSLAICLFARKIYGDRRLVARCLDTLGIEKTPDELGEIGKKIFALKHTLKQKLGFKLDEVSIPKRFLRTKALGGQLDSEQLEKLTKVYREKLREIVGERGRH